MRKEAAAAFRVPLGYFLFRVIPDWIRGTAAEGEAAEAVAESREAVPIPPLPVPPTAGPPVEPGLRDTVIAVVTALAQLGLVQIPGAVPAPAAKPLLPPELHPGAAPVVVGNEIAGAWAPPPRPTLEGPRSAVRRAMYEMLSRG